MSRVLTENHAPTFDSSDDARLDFLFNVIEGSPSERTTDLLEKSWKTSPLDTMKLIMNARDIRHGKGIRIQFYICLKWLYNNQFESLLANLKIFSEFGSWKDYLNLLLIALFGETPYDCIEKKERTLKQKPEKSLVSQIDRIILKSLPLEKRQKLNQIKTTYLAVKRKMISTHEKTDNCEDSGTTVVTQTVIKQSEQSEPIKYKNRAKYFPESVSKKSKSFYSFKTGKEKLKLLNLYRIEHFKKVYREDEKFKRLYDEVVRLFAIQLVEDYSNMKAGKHFSLASKWLPNPRRYFDKYLCIYLPIASKFLEIEASLLQVNNAASKDDYSIIRKLFHQVYSALRKKMNLPEQAMSSKDWHNVQYFAVPSVAMLRYRASFVRYDFDRLTKFIESKPAKGGALTPGEIVRETIKIAFMDGSLYGTLNEELSKEKQLEENVLQSQWESLINDIRSKGSLVIKESLAICDVSGSMMDSSKVPPMYGAIGLTLTLLQLSSGLWSNRCISFSEEPKIFKIDLKDKLKDQISQMTNIEFGYSTNLNKTFDLILNHGKNANIPNSAMPKVLFIFTDMEFDQAQCELTNFQSCQEQYRLAGYSMPLIVFWNLRGNKANRSTPVKCHQEGVFLLSGYSAQTLNFFFSCNDLSAMTPLSMLEQVIKNPIYDCVTVAESSTNSIVSNRTPMETDN